MIIIGDFLKELKLIEGRNTGIPTIVRAMEQNGSGKPIFETDENRSYLTVILPCHSSFIQTEKEIKNSETKSRKSIEEIMELIITALKQNGEMSSKNLAVFIGYTKVTEAVAKAIKQLMIDGKIEYTIKDNVKDKNQKIRIIG